MHQAWQERRFPAKFHYSTPAHARHWLHIHQTFSPSRTDPSCLAIYDAIFAQAARLLQGQSAQLCGLGCGGGVKDAHCLKTLDAAGVTARYVPCDVSPTLALTSALHARNQWPDRSIRPLVADLEGMTEEEPFWRQQGPEQETQLFSLLGMLPNLDPAPILKKIAAWSRPGDLLIVSANLAPGPDYEAGCLQILPQYANAETEAWLGLIFEQVGINRRDIRMDFRIEPVPGNPQLRRVVVRAFALRNLMIHLLEDTIPWGEGESFEVFSSNRFTPSLLETLVTECGWAKLTHAIIPSGEEGVWLMKRVGI